MRFLYNIGIRLYATLLWLIAPFHSKAKLWVDGRKNLLDKIAQTVEKGANPIWFHFASLGEFEQGRSVMEAIKSKYPTEKILITFFSPSGYEIRKNTPLADYVFYLPNDTAQNAKRFLELVNPKLAIFTKYEYWYHYFDLLEKRKIRLIMISAIFREDQLFFKSYGSFYRSILKKVSYFFAQNMDSVHMLKWISITNAGLAGDTRFDRVVELPKQQRAIPELQQFLADADHVLVAGSTWEPDEAALSPLMKNNPDWKLILAPHEIHAAHIAAIEKQFSKALFFTKFASYSAAELQQAQVLVIDNIGMLSSLYGYGQLAYIGGGFGVGIHNTLEAAAYGVPVVFGPNYQKFQEAKDLLELGAGFAIPTADALPTVFAALQQPEKRAAAGAAAGKYVLQKSGATKIIMKYLETEGLVG